LKTLLSLFLISSLCHALEVDERLTLRILKISDSRKTVLVNRGEEDGLKKGDHAKFFTTAGVVARGMVIKVSPMRSIWSVYRLVNADTIRNDSVMNIKITKPVKVSYDNTKMLVSDDKPTSTIDAGGGFGAADVRDLGIPLAAGAEDEAYPLTAAERAELAELRSKVIEKDISIKRKEIWGMVQLLQTEQNVSTGGAPGEYSTEDIEQNFILGGEYYFKNRNMWYYNFSLLGMVNMLNTSSSTIATITPKNEKLSIFEWGAGLNYYFMKEHSKAETFIPFGTFMYTTGSSNIKISDATTSASEGDLSGSTTSTSFGFGLKYYTFKGWGVRAIFDYYSRSETYEVSGPALNFTDRTTSGFRFLTGLSYRW
jgi:hypothetical protein